MPRAISFILTANGFSDRTEPANAPYQVRAAASAWAGPGERHVDVMTTLKELKERLMEDPAFQEEYERADDEFALIEALVRARTAAKLTQVELARRLGTTQSAIARLEGGRVSPSFATLRRYAAATGTRLTVRLVQADS